MSTVQKHIRDAIVAKLGTLQPTLQVFRAPRRELAETELPCVAIYSAGDRPENGDDDHQKAHFRVYTVRVEVRVADRPEEDATDALAVKVRQAMLVDDTLGGLCTRITWQEQTWDGDEGEFPLAGTALDFACTYLWRPE